MDVRQLLYWMEEREKIRRHHDAGDPWPWTNDPILSVYSFTNVRREDDRVSKWIADNLCKPNAEDPDLWFLLTVGRFVNWPDTLAELGCFLPWNRKRFLDVMAARAARGAQLYGPAYMIHADNKTGKPTPQYQAADVFNPLWLARKDLRPRVGDTLAGYFSRFDGFHCMGGFMRGQVIADLKFAPPLNDAPDWGSFAVSGPGSRRGLNRVLGRPKDARWANESAWGKASERAWRKDFDQFRAAIADDLERLGLGDLDAQSLQSCLCEYDKFERTRLGEGRPKRRYRPTDPPKPPKGPPPRKKGMLF